MTTYYTLLTTDGAAKIATAIATNTPITLTEVALGDGNGSPVTPTVNTAALVNEVYRAGVNSVLVNPQNAQWVNVDLTLPSGVGNWTIREFMILDGAGDVIFVGNLAAQPKPLITEGTAIDLFLRFIVEVSETSAITMTIDPNLIMATQQFVTVEINNALTNAQGSGNGFDADTVGGKHATDFILASKEGSGNGLNADLLDGNHASAFQPAGSYADLNHNHDGVYSKLGIGQTWQDVTGSRVSGTPYTNSTSKPVQVIVSFPDTGGDSAVGAIEVDGVTLISLTYDIGAGSATLTPAFIVPPGSTYKATISGTTMPIDRWVELRDLP